METPRIRSYPKDRDYRDEHKDEALRMMRSLMDQAGVSHGYWVHRERGPVRALPFAENLPSNHHLRIFSTHLNTSLRLCGMTSWQKTITTLFNLRSMLT